MNTKARTQIKTRIRKKIQHVSDRAKLSIFRSNRYCYAQVIDKKGNAIVGLSEKTLIETSKDKSSSMDRAKELGIAIAKLALDKKIKEVVFDKGRFAYHGKVKAIAQGAREGGLSF